MADTAYERVLCVKNEVQVYKIPPRPSNRGYRANDWKLEAPDWTGRMRVVAINNDLFIKLEDRNSGELFAQCPVEGYPGIAVESVMDSSRYFVIRIKDEGGRSAFIGIGFHDRADSFDLNVSLQDHFKWIKQEAEEAKKGTTFDVGPKLDLGFKEGQTITLNLGTKKGDGKPRPKPASGGGGMAPFLPPPPGGLKMPPPSAAVPQASVDPPPQANSSSQSSTQKVDLLFGMDLPPASTAEPAKTNQNPPDLWGDFTGAGGSQSASSANSDSAWIQF